MITTCDDTDHLVTSESNEHQSATSTPTPAVRPSSQSRDLTHLMVSDIPIDIRNRRNWRPGSEYRPIQPAYSDLGALSPSSRDGPSVPYNTSSVNYYSLT